MIKKDNPMIALKYIAEDERWKNKNSSITNYRSFYSDTLDKINEALPNSKASKAYYIQGLAVVETKAYYNIQQRCWVTNSDEQRPEMYEDGGQNV